MTTPEVRVRLSVGLFLIAILHVAALVATQTVVRERITRPVQTPSWQVPDRSHSPQRGNPIERLAEPPAVNYRAQGELKQQFVSNCSPCNPGTVTRRWVGPSRVVSPSVVVGPARVVPNRVVPNNDAPPRVVHPVQPAPSPAPMVVTPVAHPQPAAILTSPAPPQPRKGFEIALFVTNDSQSRQLIHWFDTDPGLRTLRQRCEFQTYTPTNPLYKTRFASIVPPEQFPVVLFQDSTGGHVHAAGRNMIPNSPAELFADMKTAFGLYQQAKSAVRTGLVKTSGYSWDDAITPVMQLEAEDCPDGYCPNEPPADAWRPGDHIRDRLFDGAVDAAKPVLDELMLRLVAGVVIAIAVVGLIVVLIRRGA
ncbi:hypothetical protein [Rhodopirellula sp. SWK7]|uniref:hypothetical protein n=1 Tax=Rhodopirellula sp. SWK7 TaxID=595460 RepID=UPI0002BDB5B9|nr:hypothetical protein [Rhodopirellula sp. SWK7]EMI41701.1 membrane protein [Rhodopirellula sp. SWK7]